MYIMVPEVHNVTRNSTKQFQLSTSRWGYVTLTHGMQVAYTVLQSEAAYFFFQKMMNGFTILLIVLYTTGVHKK